MGFSLSSSLGYAKVNKKILGKKGARWGDWGYWKKKTGINKIFGSPSSASSYRDTVTNSSSSIYGHTGSIVGKY